MNETTHPKRRLYIPVKYKFALSQVISLLWMLFSIWLSRPWIHELSHALLAGWPAGEHIAAVRDATFMLSILIITGIAYIPGFLNAFLVTSLLFDRQPPHKEDHPIDAVTVIIACRNEERGIADTIRRVAWQDYDGPIRVIVADNGSTDDTARIALEVGASENIDVRVIYEGTPGKNHALNTALKSVDTPLVITLDADTLLQKSAIRYLISRMNSAPDDICAVAGAVLVRNSRDNLLAKMQEWDYFLGIASIKRLQGLYQGTLVAQGAFSLYTLDALREVGGWPDAIGEDIVLTWRFLERGHRVYFEPLAVAFTDVPTKLSHFIKQRNRWARGMIEALKAVKPWQHPRIFQKFLTGFNLFMPFLDITYTFVWMPGLILACFGIFAIVGPSTLFVLPLTFLSNYVLYQYQRKVFKVLGLRIRKNWFGFLCYVLGYQMLMSPISVWGYTQEVLKLRRVWK